METGRRGPTLARLHVHFSLLVRLLLAQRARGVLVLLNLVELLLPARIGVLVLREDLGGYFILAVGRPLIKRRIMVPS